MKILKSSIFNKFEYGLIVIKNKY